MFNTVVAHPYIGSMSYMANDTPTILQYGLPGNKDPTREVGPYSVSVMYDTDFFVL